MKRIAAILLTALLAVALATFAKEKHEGPYVLKAKGSHGWIKFAGSGPGSARISGKGSLTIENISKQTVVKVDGTWGEKRDYPDGVNYTHFEGSVETVGIGVHLELRGWNLELSTKGIGGQAKFQGVGTAQLDDEPERPWPGADNTAHSWLKISYGDH